MHKKIKHTKDLLLKSIFIQLESVFYLTGRPIIPLHPSRFRRISFTKGKKCMNTSWKHATEWNGSISYHMVKAVGTGLDMVEINQQHEQKF